MNFKKLNNIAGWSIFVIATLVYLLTLERTASFWDTGEFIAAAYKLMVPHPPGAPFFLLIGRMFSFLAMGDVTQVAYWINVSSALASGFTILFLFWSITLIGLKIYKLKPTDILSRGQLIAILGAGAIGALSYTFSDSFWFSAVEAEVYALSSFFTAIVFWAMLKWEHIEDPAASNRWLILLAYIMGLSIGVHLLNLVTIPALGLIYYFKKYENPTRWGILGTMVVSSGILLLINNFIIPGLPSIAGVFELSFVNTFGLPFGSGIIFFGVIFIGSLVYGIIYTQQRGKTLANLLLLGVSFVLIGYSSYTLVVVRSNFNPPIDENNPENIMSFVSYLKREQYGTRPLLHGQYFTARIIGTNEGEKVYRKGEDKYEVIERKISYIYDPDHTTILPRMYSASGPHVQRYREVTGLAQGAKPSFFDNIYFMVKHQIGHMYFRYFMWNFSGRAGDDQDASYLTILDAFDNPPDFIKNNKARNNYFMIPLILGLLGLFFHLNRDKKSFAVVALLFFLTGLALILYLNSPPVEPRERDYIYVGSFYAFAIWIGFGVMAIYEGLKNSFKRNEIIAGGLAVAICLSSPAIMAQQGWDDHNRNNRYFSVDIAKNFLTSTAPNAIMFTGGDNDTFPLWYIQEVEGFRTDVRVVVLSYFNTDWYIDQMTEPIYESEAFPFSLAKEHYRQGGSNDYLPFEDRGIREIDLNQYLSLIRSKDTRLQNQSGYTILPSSSISLKVNREEVLAKGIIPEGMDSLVVDKMVFQMKEGRNALEKKDLMILDLIATANWDRPLYVNNTSREQINFDLSPYLVMEGNAYRLLPVQNPRPRAELVNIDLTYDNMMNKFQFREMDNPNSYYNEDYRRFVLGHRSNFNSLAISLINSGQEERARKVLLYNLEVMPDKAVPYDYTTLQTIDLLFAVGESEKAVEIGNVFATRSVEILDYAVDQNWEFGYMIQLSVTVVGEVQRMFFENGELEKAEYFEDQYERIMQDLGSMTRPR